jgi:hypothetical protein
VKELQERIDDAIFFLETEYNTYPSGEAWRKALKKILEGNKIKKLEGSTDISTSLICRLNNIEVKINEIIDKLEEIE